MKRLRKHLSTGAFVAAILCLAAACLTQAGFVGWQAGPRNEWWQGHGPVLPHDSFPADCELCHVGSKWQSLKEDFEFDHEAETGYALTEAHAAARCLRCHNDRGPVAVFEAQGCIGCHEDIHTGELGDDCLACHDQTTWQARGMVARHNRTRFPLVGRHASTACWRCHEGAEIGQFLPLDTTCLTCHAADQAAALNPNHNLLGYVDQCHRCHMTTTWNQAEVDPAY